MGRTIAKPLEEQVEACSALVTETETRSAISAIGPVVDIVLEQALATIVGEPFCQFDDGNEVCRRRQILADTAERATLVFIWLFSLRGGIHFDIGRGGGSLLLVDI